MFNLSCIFICQSFFHLFSSPLTSTKLREYELLTKKALPIFPFHKILSSQETLGQAKLIITLTESLVKQFFSKIRFQSPVCGSFNSQTLRIPLIPLKLSYFAVGIPYVRSGIHRSVHGFIELPFPILKHAPFLISFLASVIPFQTCDTPLVILY